MSRPRTAPESLDLPSGVRIRTWTDKRQRRHTAYYYALPRDEQGKRKLMPLGTDKDEMLRRLRVKPFGILTSPEFKHQLYARSMKNAGARRIPFLLTREQLDRMFERANGRCEVSGIEFDYKACGRYRARAWIPSIDRIECKGAYSFDNCRLVCAYINMALNEFGLETLLFASKQIVYHATVNAVGIDEMLSSRMEDGESNRSCFGESKNSDSRK